MAGKRHQKAYNPDNPNPYELARGRIEQLIKCEGCFWLRQAKGINPPSIAGYNLNSNTDTLLKKDADRYRGKEEHPIMLHAGFKNIRPWEHEHLGKWLNSMHFGTNENYFNTIHEETNIKFGGGCDDVYENIETGELYIIDYKSTANLKKDPVPVNLDGKWKGAYKRQADMYVWILRRRGYQVSDTAFFIYVDGQHKAIDGMMDKDNPGIAWMKFNTSVLPYQVNTDWVEDALYRAKEVYTAKTKPKCSEDCEHGQWFDKVTQAIGE